MISIGGIYITFGLTGYLSLSKYLNDRSVGYVII